MKCKEDVDCEKLFRGHGILTRSEKRFGSDPKCENKHAEQGWGVWSLCEEALNHPWDCKWKLRAFMPTHKIATFKERVLHPLPICLGIAARQNWMKWNNLLCFQSVANDVSCAKTFQCSFSSILLTSKIQCKELEFWVVVFKG